MYEKNVVIHLIIVVVHEKKKWRDYLDYRGYEKKVPKTSDDYSVG